MSATFDPAVGAFLGFASPNTGNTTISNDPVARLEREITQLYTQLAQRDETIQERDDYILLLETSLGLKLAEAVKGREEEIQQLGVDQGYQSGLEDAVEDLNRSYDGHRTQLRKDAQRITDDLETILGKIGDLMDLLPTKLE